MKKFLFLLLAATAFAACDNDEDNFTPDAGSYNCLLVVSEASTGDETNRTANVVCNLNEQSDKSVSLTMNSVKFTDNPREPVKTIVFPKLASRHESGTIYFENVGEIVPEIDGAPYKNYQISNFSCRLTDNASTFHLTFTCINATYHLNHIATFDGTIIQ